MKGRLIKVGVLAAVFVIALIASSLVINRGTDDKIVDMGAPSLPRISFLVGEQEVNALCGYIRDMDLTSMRDTITPLGQNGSLSMKIEGDAQQIQNIRYEVYSLDGQETYADGKAAVPGNGEDVVLNLGSALQGALQEGVLKVVLDMEDGKNVSYYTRVILPDELVVSECLSFAQDFHAKALAQDKSAGLESYLEPGEASDNTTYQTVNIHSDITHVLWGELAPQVLGDVEWDIQEANSVYTSILARYQTVCKDENGESGVYNIREFFRVRSVQGTIYLLDYNRNMEKVFTGNDQALSQSGIILGTASENVQYEMDKDEMMVAFVQDRDLWLYDTKASEFTQIFSFADQEGSDVRSKNDRHNVRITGVDSEGNVSFVVCGYMNRGAHEGETGVGVYYFDKADSLVTEKAFISSTSGPAITAETFGQIVYYAKEQDMLYALVGGTLYEINIKNDDQTILAEELEDKDYVLSEDGRMLAYRTVGEDEDGAAIEVLDLDSGEGYTVQAEDGEDIRPLGFINGDFIYGKINPSDKGQDVSGREIEPMYEVEIRNSENEEEAKYSFIDQGLYTSDILIEDNLLTLNRVEKSGDRYQTASQEYITNNTERMETKVTVEIYSADVMEKQVRLTLSEGVGDLEPKTIKADFAADGRTLTLMLGENSGGMKFYVYGMGGFAGMYDRAGDAVQEAERISGVVVSSDQHYVWEKGNRNLSYSTETPVFVKEGDETSLEACERYMQSYEAHQIDLTGCTLEQILYVIGKGRPVTALISSDHAVMLTGYTTTDITYIDPDMGQEYTVDISTMEDMTEAGGNVFIGYIR